jgi:dihydropyrimidinase
MLDIVIRGGTVVTPQGAGVMDVAIQGEQIVALGAPGVLTDDAQRTIDATGKIVIPGGIDPHIHAKWHLPAIEGGEPGLSAGPEHVSQAALHGGTTTLLDFAAWQDGETLQQTIEKRDLDWHGQCHTDYSFHVMLSGDVPPDVLDQIPETIQSGFPSIKMFTTDITPSRKGRMVRFGTIWEAFQRIARHNGVAAIHAEDNDLVMHMYDKLTREGRTGFENMAEVHSTLSEDMAFARVLRLARHVDGAALYMVHVSAGAGVEAISEARGRGLPIYGETLHHYASFTSDAYKRPNGQIYHTYPSLKGDDDCRALWDGMADGTIVSIATDGICTPLQVKVQGKRIDDTTGGNAGVEPRVGIMYTETVVKRGMSLEKFVGLTSANAARVFGLYPRKGAIAPGSDADIVLIDPSIDRVLAKEDLHETDYSPWEGWHVHGWPVMTLLRGRVVVEDGQLLVGPDYGKIVPRKVADAILSGPSV